MLKKSFTLFSFLFLVSCASSTEIIQLDKNQYTAKCPALFGNCLEKMQITCPKGYDVMNKSSEYSYFTGTKEVYIFKCLKK